MFDKLKVKSRRLIAKHRQTTMVRALHGIAAFIDTAYENDEWDMAANGETSLLRRLRPAGLTTVFDVGAHVGDWSIEALRAWSASHVHDFEVAPPTYERLATHVAASGLSTRTRLH